MSSYFELIAAVMEQNREILDRDLKEGYDVGLILLGSQIMLVENEGENLKVKFHNNAYHVGEDLKIIKDMRESAQ